MSEIDTVEFSTSGSTGRAKSVFKSKASLDADAAMLAGAFPDLFADKPFVLATIREEHMFGALWRVRVPRFASCEVHPATVVSVEELVSAASGRGKVLLLTTPSFLENAVKDADFAALAPLLAGIVTSGSLLKEDLAARVAEVTGIAVTEIFGSTETGSVAWRRQGSGGGNWTLFDTVAARATPDGLLEVDSEYSLARPFVMGDKVEFVSPRVFQLLGRADRNVKILERYVSLPELEAVLEKHRFIAKAHAIASDEAVPRIRALVELTVEGRRELIRTTYSEVTAVIKRECSGIEPFAFPRRIRYVNRFPYNEQGKLPRSAVAPLLKSRYQEPVVENESSDENTFAAELTFIPDAFYFDGHFREFSILPGVVQLDWVERCIRRKWRTPAFAGEIARLKFQRPVLPREKIRFELTRACEGRFSFSFKSGDIACSSGEFRFRETPPARPARLSPLVAVFASLLTLSAFAQPGPRGMFENAMRRALDSSAAWTMTKTVTGTPLRLSAKGTVTCVKGDGIIWKMEQPLESTVQMEAGRMKFTDAQGERTVEAGDMPHYRSIRQAVDGFFAGKPSQIEKLFEVTAEKNGEGWRVVLSPRRRDIRHIVRSVTVWGGATVDKAEFVFSSGETAVYEFQETKRGGIGGEKGGK